MGQTLYAEARRGVALTEGEISAVWAIMGEFDVADEIESFVPGGDGLNWESFLWSPDGSDGVVLSGSTRLPDVSLSATFTGINHWGRMLGRIRTEVLADAVWDVNVDGDPVSWLEDEQRFGVSVPAGLDLDKLL